MPRLDELILDRNRSINRMREIFLVNVADGISPDEIEAAVRKRTTPNNEDYLAAVAAIAQECRDGKPGRIPIEPGLLSLIIRADLIAR